MTASPETQKFLITLKVEVERDVYPGDPDDVYKLAEMEKIYVEEEANRAFEGGEVVSLDVVPVLESK